MIYFLIFPFLIFAQTFSENKKAELVQIHPLEKVTVGPDDHYQPVRRGNFLYFTKNKNYSTQIWAQDIESQVETLKTSPSVDSKDLNIFEQKIALTSFESDARGDICYGENFESLICLKQPMTHESSAFWKSNTSFYYVSKESENTQGKIFLYDLESKSSTFIAKGESPASSGGQFAYVSSDRKIYLNESRLRLDLPGVSGFPRFSKDGKFLYFSHYMSDSNSDGRIDGSDRSVIFRQSVANPSEFPMQITSQIHNCSYVFPSDKKLYVACAFEGSLDVYTLPLSGQIPLDWNEKTLDRSYETSRNYEHRLFVGNYRRHKTNGDKSLTQLFSNHMFLSESGAALFYLEKMKLDLGLKAVLEVEVLRKSLKIKELKTEINRKIKSLKSSLDPMYRAYLAFYSGRKPKMAMISIDAKDRLYQSLYFRLLELMDADATKFLPAVNSKKLSYASRVYYADYILSKLDDNEPKRIAVAEKFSIQEIYEAERLSLQVTKEKSKKDKQKVYSQLATLMNKNRTNYPLMKAVYKRSIINFTRSSELRQLEYIASTWVRYTKKEDTEFSYARELYGQIMLDKAFENLLIGKTKFASGQFFGTIGLTDFSEAHYGYVVAQLLLGDQKALQKKYERMLERKTTDIQFYYASALMSVLAIKDYRGAYKTLIEAYDRFDSSHNLLKGYLELMIMRETREGKVFDKDLADKSHKSLMLAFDLGGERVRASALENLGHLHFETAHYGMSAEFYSKRSHLGFEGDIQKKIFYWDYARSLFYSYRYTLAYEMLEKTSNLWIENRNILDERLAFYAVHAKKYKKAVKHYESVNTLEGTNQFKKQIGLGLSLLRLKKYSSARAVLLKALKLAQTDRQNLLCAGLLSQTERGLKYLSKRLKIIRESKTLKIDDTFPLEMKTLLQMGYRNLKLHQNEKAEKILDLTLKKVIRSGREKSFYQGRAFLETLKANFYAKQRGLKINLTNYQKLYNHMSEGASEGRKKMLETYLLQ